MYFGFCGLVRAREGLLGRLEDDPVWTAFLEDLTDEEACIVYPYVFRQLVPGVAEILERTHPLQRHQTALLAKANNSIFSLLTFNPRLDTSIFSAVASYIDDESVHACFITMLTHVDKHMHSVIERGRPPHHETLAPFGTTFAREDVLCHITQPERATLAGKLMFLPKVCCPTLFRTTVADWVPQDMFTVAEVLFGPTSSHTHTQRKKRRRS